MPEVDISDKALHFATYLILTLWFTGLYRESRYLIIAVSLFLLGVGLEFLQGHISYVRRNMDSMDVLANGTGIALALLLALAGLGGWCARVEAWITKQ